MVSTCWGHWKMNEASGNALDALGVRDLTQTGTVPAQAGGKINGARGAYSTSNYFSRANGTFLSTQNFSIACWVKCINTTIGTRDVFANWGAATNNFQLYLGYGITSGKFSFIVGKYGVGLSLWIDVTQALTLNAWYWICGTYNASTGAGTFTVNNAAPGTDTYTNGAAVAPTTLYFGVEGPSSGPSSPSDNFYIDDLRLYTDVLTSDEKTFIYNSGSGTESELGGAAKFRHFGKFWWKK